GLASPYRHGLHLPVRERQTGHRDPDHSAGRLPPGDPTARHAAMRLSRWVLLWLLIIGVLVAIGIGVVTGRLVPIGSVLIFLIGLMVVSVLSIIGAVFVGMFVSHRILSTKGFTPFEQEMLRMRQEVRELSDRLGEIAPRLAPGTRNKPP